MTQPTTKLDSSAMGCQTNDLPRDLCANCNGGCSDGEDCVNAKAPQAATTEQAGELVHQMRHRAGGVWTNCDADGETCIKRMPQWADAYEFRTLQVISPAATTASASGDAKPCGWLAGDTSDGGEMMYYRREAAQRECDQQNEYERSLPDFDAATLRAPEPVYRAPAPSREAAVAQIKTWKERCGDTGQMPSLKEAASAMQAEIADLRAALAEWEKLRNQAALHQNLLRGIPAKLSARELLHIAGYTQHVVDAALAGRDAAPLDKRALDIIEIAARIFDFKPHKQTEETKAKYLRFADEIKARAALAQPAAPVVDGELPPLPGELIKELTDAREVAWAMIPAMGARQVGNIIDKALKHFAAARSAPVASTSVSAVALEGYKLVPKRAFLEMQEAGVRCACDRGLALDTGDTQAIYAAMLAAAPDHSGHASEHNPEPAGGKEESR